jgi:hypothetical protein
MTELERWIVDQGLTGDGVLALAANRMTLLDPTVGMLDTYLGFASGRRVLSGEIRRGSGGPPAW